MPNLVSLLYCLFRVLSVYNCYFLFYREQKCGKKRKFSYRLAIPSTERLIDSAIRIVSSFSRSEFLLHTLHSCTERCTTLITNFLRRSLQIRTRILTLVRLATLLIQATLRILTRLSLPIFTDLCLEFFSIWSWDCLLYTSPSPRDQRGSRMPSSA